MTVTATYAAEHLDDLLSALDVGEAVEITRPDKPVVRLSSEAIAESAPPSRKRILGAGVGEMRVPSDDEWEEMDRQWRASFADKFAISE